MSDRAQVFARGALQKGLVSRAQAEECLTIAAKLAQRGKPLAIEEVFVRKGYLRKTEARALAKRIRKKQPQAPPPLALAPEPQRRGCPSCGRDPGRGADCFRCGADLATGAPGPRGVACDGCGRVMLRGSAICHGCAAPIGEARPERRGRSVLLDRLILIATLAGVGYFLVYRNLIAPPPAPPAPTASAPAKDPLDLARDALEAGEPARAVELLEAELAKLDASAPGRRRILRALVLTAPPRRARLAAQEVLADGPDARVLRRLAELELADGQARPAAAHLRRVDEAARDDGYWRLRAQAERGSGGDWVSALSAVQRLLPAERRRLALELATRGRTQLDGGHLPQAEATLRRATELDPDLAAARCSLGVTLLRAGKPADARAELERSLKADPRPAATYLALGLTLEQLKERTKAIQLLQEYVRLAAAAKEPASRIASVEARIKRLQR